MEDSKEHLLKVTLRLPHRTNARKLDAPVCGTHGGTFSRLRIGHRGGEERTGGRPGAYNLWQRALRTPRSARREL